MKLQESPPGLEPRARGLSPTVQAGHATFVAGPDSPMAPPMIGSRSSWAARFVDTGSLRGRHIHAAAAVPAKSLARRPAKATTCNREVPTRTNPAMRSMA